MVVLTIVASIALVLFEVSLREITLFSHVCGLILTVNTLYWFGRHKPAIAIGVISGFLVDLMVQNRFGETVLSIFIPLLILSFFDNLLQVEGKGSRIVLTTVGSVFAILISDFLLKLLFWEGNLEFSLVVRRMLVTSFLGIILTLLFGKFIQKTEKEGKYL